MSTFTSKVVYYPRIQSINFYGVDGKVSGGMLGSMARDKFRRLLKEGRFPRISFRKHVKVVL